MKFYSRDNKQVFKLPAQDFVNFNLAEAPFKHRPSNQEIIQLFSEMPISLTGLTDAKDLAQAVQHACLVINGLSIKEDISLLELELIAKIEPTHKKVVDLDDYDYWDTEDLRTLWP